MPAPVYGRRMTRLCLVSKHNYFAMKKDRPWFSKWCSHDVLPEGKLKARKLETEFQRYRRLALARGDKILYLVHAVAKECGQ